MMGLMPGLQAYLHGVQKDEVRTRLSKRHATLLGSLQTEASRMERRGSRELGRRVEASRPMFPQAVATDDLCTAQN